MEQDNINFDSFELLGNSVLIEYPTKTQFGLILINSENNTMSSGWYKIVKVSEEAQKANPLLKPNKEAYIYFHHKPIEIEELVLKSRYQQKRQMEKDAAKEQLILPNTNNPLSPSFVEPERTFAVVRGFDVIFIRDFENV